MNRNYSDLSMQVYVAVDSINTIANYFMIAVMMMMVIVICMK